VLFIDSNIPMYLIGASHPNKDPSRRLLEMCIERAERLVTDAEVLQEILHRYIAIRRRDAIQPAFNALLGVVDVVFPVEGQDGESARDVLLGESGLSSVMRCTWPSCGVTAFVGSCRSIPPSIALRAWTE
jgi:predicted nucleic acid-binding protein